jgi:HSP20 family molecular chaperone IbpA
MYHKYDNHCDGPAGDCGHGPGFNFRAGFGPEFGPAIGQIIRKAMNVAGFHGMKAMHDWRGFFPHSLHETDTEYIVLVPLPGYDPEEVEVSVKGNELLIDTKDPEEAEEQQTGETAEGSEGSEEEEEITEKVLMNMGEHIWNKPRAHLRIPFEAPINEDTVRAKLAKGILTVRFQKTPGKTVKVDVDVGGQ